MEAVANASPLQNPASDGHDTHDFCPICRERFGAFEVVAAQCGHRFDLKCITPWLDDRPLEDRKCYCCAEAALPLMRLGNAPAAVIESNRYIRSRALDAVYKDDTATLAALLKSHPDALSGVFHEPLEDLSVSLLMAAARHGRPRCVAALLRCLG